MTAQSQREQQTNKIQTRVNPGPRNNTRTVGIATSLRVGPRKGRSILRKGNILFFSRMFLPALMFPPVHWALGGGGVLSVEIKWAVVKLACRFHVVPSWRARQQLYLLLYNSA